MNWKDWLNKKVFIRTRHDKVFSGTIQEVDDDSPPLIWITILDKFNDRVTFAHSEIVEIREVLE